METKIQKVVMQRVRYANALKSIFSYGTLSVCVSLVALYGIGREVWVARVFENMPSVSDAGAVAQFFFSAFTHTDFLVQALILLAVASTLFASKLVADTLTGAFSLSASRSQ